MRTSFSASRLSSILLPIAGLAIGVASRPETPAPPGGHEVFCNGAQEVHERWPSVPAGGVPWRVAAGPVWTLISPGLPPFIRDAGLPDAQRPAIQSMARAARAWSNVKVPIPVLPGGGPVALPYPQPIASTFRFTVNPASYLAWSNYTQNDADRMVLDGSNLVTCWQPDGWWQLVGGPAALAAAFVWLGGGASPGDIVEGDIALNTRTEANAAIGQPAWSFVEFNSYHQKTYATHIFDRFNEPYVDPALGYADMQGVMTHEFGHLAGLGHSLLDSRQAGGGTLFPTMFPYAQVEPYAATLHFYLSESGGMSNYLMPDTDASATTYGGVLGSSARSLELDDVAAIADTYAAPAFTSMLGAITGTCFLDSLATPLRGAHVVAFREDAPDSLRVGAISYAGGVYTLRGLPPGDWYVYAEPVDQPPPPFTAGGYYFDPFGVPNYVFQGPSGCIATQPFFVTEFRNAGEAFGETTPMRATKITVAAGQTAAGVDFHLDSGTDMLTLKVQGGATTHESARGLIVSPQGTPFPTVQARIRTSSSFAGQTAYLVAAATRSSLVMGGQVFLPTLGGATILTAVLDASGGAVIAFPTGGLPVFTNTFFQAAVPVPGGGGLRFSNPLNLWLASP